MHLTHVHLQQVSQPTQSSVLHSVRLRLFLHSSAYTLTLQTSSQLSTSIIIMMQHMPLMRQQVSSSTLTGVISTSSVTLETDVSSQCREQSSRKWSTLLLTFLSQEQRTTMTASSVVQSSSSSFTKVSFSVLL